MTRPMQSRRSFGSSFVRVAVLVSVIAGGLVTGAAPSGAAPKWSVVPSPSPAGPPLGTLSGVSCASAKSCVAVGVGAGGVLAERWNGTGWKLVHAPIPSSSQVELNAASCSSSTNCVAVGDSVTQTDTSYNVATLAERWNGRQWSILPSPTPNGASDVELSGISCVSAKSCFAVGDVSTGAGLGSGGFDQLDFTTLIEHWNGSAWSIVPSPNPKGAAVSLLSGVSCVSATSCFAVGAFFGNTAGGALIERWNGSRWSVVASPEPDIPFTSHLKYRIKPGILNSFVISGELIGVSCSTAKSCFAVGDDFSGGGLIERWNGKKWSIVPSPTPPGASGGELAGVSCASPTDCAAVGSSFSGSFFDPIGGSFGSDALSEHWNGTVWSIVPQPAGAQFSALSGVSCPKANNCAAVGDSAFVQHWNGTHWGVAPFTSKTSQSRLLDVSCPSTTSCFAVGSSSTGKVTKTLTERRVGTHWKIVPSPSPAGATSTALSGVSCLSATDCTAVGSSLTLSTQPFSETQQTLAEHWDGSTWSIVPSPSGAGSPISELTSVSCASPSSCTAVGLSLSQTAAAPLIEHWDGAAWSVVPAPMPAFGAFDLLTSVSCPSTSNCTAVGYYEAFTGTRQETARTLVEHWNGTSWSILPSPNVKSVDLNALFGVSCPSATNCSAVGVSESVSGTTATSLTEHWNGKKWAIVASPKLRRSIATSLGSISCRGTSSCYAVGFYSTLDTDKTLVEHWNGRSWKVIPSPSPGTSGAGLNGVSCATRANCTAVGSYGANNGFFTLIERGT